MITRLVAMVAVALVPCLAGAATTGEEDAMLINRLNATDFEVVETRGMAAQDFWCGAATFVERRNGLSETTEIYIRGAQGPSRTAPGLQAVVFSTSNKGLPAIQARSTITIKVVGAKLKSAQARSFCRDAFTRSTK